MTNSILLMFASGFSVTRDVQCSCKFVKKSHFSFDSLFSALRCCIKSFSNFFSPCVLFSVLESATTIVDGASSALAGAASFYFYV